MKNIVENRRKCRETAATPVGWRRLSLAIAALAAVALAGCSSAPKASDTTTPAPAATPATAAQPAVVDAGIEVDTTTGTGKIESIDSAQRRIGFRRADGTLVTFRAGPDVANFDQLKPGDEVVATLTETCALFVVKGAALPPGEAGATVVARAPKGGTPGALALGTLDYNATVMDVDLEKRRVLLKYGPDQANSIKVGPGVDLTKLAVGDEVLVRATESLAVTVVKP